MWSSLVTVVRPIPANRKEDLMLDKYVSAPKTLARLRAGLSGPYIDGFADALEQDGYSHGSSIRYLRAAAHLGQFLQSNGGALADINASTLDAFRRHLTRCDCPSSNGGRVNHHVFFGAKRFHAHLFQMGVCHNDPVPPRQNPEPALIASFRDWFQKHRGAAEPTLRRWARILVSGMHSKYGRSCLIAPISVGRARLRN